MSIPPIPTAAAAEMLADLPSLTDPALYERGDPYAVWAVLRRECPVSWHQSEEQSGYWAVTTYEPGLQVLTDWRRFTSTKGVIVRPSMDTPYPGAGRMLGMSDPPLHDRLRRPIAALFSSRAIAGLADRTRRTVRELLAAAVAAGECDFVSDVAAQIPLAVAGDLLAIADDEVDRLARAIASAADNTNDIDGAAAQKAHFTILRHYSRVMARRRQNPGDDVVSALIGAQADGVEITDAEIVVSCDNILGAASETTRHAASVGLLTMLENPAQWQALRDGRVPVRNATEEILRWTAPVTHMLRVAKEDTVLDGVPIRAGDPLAVWIASMNRDESVFERADEFLLHRPPSRYMTAFGGGVHYCLGAGLARLIISTLLEELATLDAEVIVAGTPRRIASPVVGGLATLPLAFRRR
ncbi:cytochrome P450 [Micromonospora sp. NPDC005215]|uniref:cytochrome P450 n=1 Tax=Micromonospora sp. NPDC005215 TaxID=3157024 RepID=UPI00339DE11D